MPNPDFDWATDPAIIIRRQPAIAVYTNPADAVVVRQEAEWDDSEDHYVFVTKDNVLDVCIALLREAELPQLANLLTVAPTPDGGAPRTSGAARTRAYRERLRAEAEAGRDGGASRVTERDGGSVRRDTPDLLGDA